MAVIIVPFGSLGRQDFRQAVLDVQLELGGDLRQVDPERAPHLTQGAVERAACPVGVMVVGIQGYLPAIDPDPVQELPAGGSARMARRLATNSDLASSLLAAKEVTDFQNRLDAVRGNFHLLRGVEHTAVF